MRLHPIFLGVLVLSGCLHSKPDSPARGVRAPVQQVVRPSVPPQSTVLNFPFDNTSNAYIAPPSYYPEEAKTTKIQGNVSVRARIDKDGNVLDAKATSGPNPLRGAAERYMLSIRFRRQIKLNKLDYAEADFVIVFRLQE